MNSELNPDNSNSNDSMSIQKSSLPTAQSPRLKVFVALSGGVDSAVSAALLKEQGYEVTGVYMKNWSGDDFGIQSECPWETDQKDAEAICTHLDIPFRSFNFEKEYRDKVVEYFFEEYKAGRTPNPDVMCNKEIKFKLFLDKALKEGADLIATGHYARRELRIENRESKFAVNPTHKSQISNLKSPYKQYSLLAGDDQNKNQVYFLYNITQEQLAKTLFPIGHLPKPEVRKLAEKFGLPNAKKPDSQGICFIGHIDVLKFLMSRIPEKKGEIRDIDTDKIVGEHKGIFFYTIGQRGGLNIGGSELPYYVCKKDGEKNILYVCKGDEHEALYRKELELENIHWIADEPKDLNNLQAMIRYRQQPQNCRLEIRDRRLENRVEKISNLKSQISIKVIFNKPQRAVASGQSLVLFDGEECLGGGIIK